LGILDAIRKRVFEMGLYTSILPIEFLRFMNLQSRILTQGVPIAGSNHPGIVKANIQAVYSLGFIEVRVSKLKNA
jgi:hypothetical protein